MKIAVASSPFAALLHGGSLTHLEWLEACASRLDADGAVFAARDLPRVDSEYAAQVKKVATDLGLVPVALDEPGLLDPAVSDAARGNAVSLALSLGAGLLCTTAGPPGEIPPKTFVATVAAAKMLAGAAKAANVTVLAGPDPASIAPDAAAIRRLLKDADSAWLRYVLPAGADRSALGPRDRVLATRVPLGADPSAVVPDRGWFVLDGDGGPDPFARAAAAVAALRAR